MSGYPATWEQTAEWAWKLAEGADLDEEKRGGGDDLGEKDATHIQTAFVFNCTTRWCWHEINDHWINGREALKNMVSQAGFELLSGVVAREPRPWTL